MSKNICPGQIIFILFLSILMMILSACSSTSGPVQETSKPAVSSSPVERPASTVDRLTVIPAGATKITPGMDILPPVLHSDKYFQPVPLGSGVNTAGGEDSAFVTPDGKNLYFFFTPDVSTPAEKQLLDKVTGIYVSQKQRDTWNQAERIFLQDRNKLALDGCVFVQGDQMWFGSAREGNYRSIDIWIADFKEGQWINWQNAGQKLNVDYEVGEFHITADGNELYFHSGRAGGKGGYDIWVSQKINGEWQSPVNIESVNSPETEGWPFVTVDGKELWFTRFYKGSPAIFKSTKGVGGWGEPELVLSQFAAEPSMDTEGNLYFTHHFFKDNKMLEADIYVAYRK
jgi:hypothetical protein